MKKSLIFWTILLITLATSCAKKFRRQQQQQEGDGYQYNAPAEGVSNQMVFLQPTVDTVVQQAPSAPNTGVSYQQYETPSQTASAVSSTGNAANIIDMEGLAGFAELEKLAVQVPKVTDGGSSVTTNVETAASVSFGHEDTSSTGHLANFGSGMFGDLLHGAVGGSGSGDQFTALEGEVINEKPPSIFEYKPRFDGKDINNLPHILPPSKKSVHELQEEADAKLRSIIEKARENQNQAIERINKLRQNYGYGTFGFDGFTDTRFKINGKIDLGTHKAIDLGTSIDYNRLKGSDGKLRLPVQNVYHTKTLGIKIPQPYPVKHEVAVPHAIPVPHPIPVPQHHPTSYTPLDHENVIHLSVDSLNQSPFSFGGDYDNKFAQFGTSDQSSHSFKGVTSSTFSIEPSQSLESTSTVLEGPYGPSGLQPGEPVSVSKNEEQAEGQMELMMPIVQTFGLPPGSQSGALSSYQPSKPPVRPMEEYGVPDNAAGSSEGHEVKSEAEMMSAISMGIGDSIMKRAEENLEHSVATVGHSFLRLRPKFNKNRARNQ